MVNLQVCGNALGTKAAFVNRKIVSRLESDDLLILDKQVHAALDAAVRAVCRHDAVYFSIRKPAVGRGIVKMRSEPVNDLW